MLRQIDLFSGNTRPPVSQMLPDERPAGIHPCANTGWAYVANTWDSNQQSLALIVLRETTQLTYAEIGELVGMSARQAYGAYRKARKQLVSWAKEEVAEQAPLAGYEVTDCEMWADFKKVHGPFTAAVFVLVVECEYNLAQIGRLIGKDRGTMSRIWRRLKAQVASSHQGDEAA